MKARSGVLLALAAGGLVLGGCETTQRAYQRVIGVNPCQDTTVTLYFEPGADDLTPAGRQIVRLTAERLRGCPVAALSIVGLADPAGAPQANVELSRRRAERVRDAFLAARLRVERLDVKAYGGEGAEHPSGAVVPVRRRVDVTVVMKRDGKGP